MYAVKTNSQAALIEGRAQGALETARGIVASRGLLGLYCGVSLDDSRNGLIRRIFDLMDANGDGQLSKAELQSVLKTHVAISKLLSDNGLGGTDDFVSQIDTGEKGWISFEELCSQVNNRMLAPPSANTRKRRAAARGLLASPVAAREASGE